ncbi:MAG TPA: flagellar hook capping FlgD N-terminal domain-containing protein [Bacillota bacterium]|nr:hypothetical protein [Clostridiales bacterium]HPT85466.1 flagellar hook capping FlgD N-terminal domain-containing protein [Bacillota bacterium]
MSTNGIYSVTAAAAAANASSKFGTDKLSTSDFLRLMAAQLQNQTMYDQTDSTEFLAQLAQFSTLSQMAELASTLKVSTAISLLGKKVTVHAPDFGGRNVTGYVTGVSMQDGVPYVKVNGTFYSIADIIEVSA